MVETFALLGWPLGGGLSAAMFNAAFRATGRDAVYVDRPTPPAELAAAVAELRAGYLGGANITQPHKLAVRAMLDDESELVSALGAVNTVRWTLGGLVGENTDVAGFAAALAEVAPGPGSGRLAVVLGAGGAARAAVHVLAEAGWAVRVLARSASQGGTLVASAYRARPGALLASGLLDPAAPAQSIPDATLVVNATPLGGSTAPGASPWPRDWPWPAGVALLDLVAWPAETPLVALARAAGAVAAGGQAMLLHQAAASYRLWTDEAAPLEAMRGALAAALAAAD